MSSPAPPAEAKNPLPLFGGAALAVAGFFAAKTATDSLGYGSDVHTLRVLALCVPLFVGGMVALRPGRKLLARAAIVLVAVGVAAAAWVYVPCRSGGHSLAAAAAERDALTARLTPTAFDDVAAAGELRQQADSLAKDYPALAAGVRADLADRAKGAAEATAARLAKTPPDDVAAARTAAEAARRLKNLFPETGGAVDSATRRWSQLATQARSEELTAVAPGDWAGFDRTAAKRKELAGAFDAVGVLLAADEDAWAARAAGGVVEATAAESPKKRREACREAEARLLALRALSDAPDRFRAARQKLFAAAHEAARAEARRHVEDRKFEHAFTVAVSHDLEWAGTTRHLGEEDRRAVADLREACRYLSRLSAKAGDLPDAAPEPRGKP